MNLLDLMVKVGIDDEVTSKIGGISDGVKSKLGTAAKAGAAAFAATTAAVGATTSAFAKGVSQVAEYGDNIDKMSQKMGMSAEAYQEWDAVMQHSGTSMETMKASMKTLANAAETGNEAFQKLGLTQEQIASMSQEELFEATISGLQNVEDTTERTYLAGQLLGRGATELGALLNQSAEETQAMRDRVHELGGVMSDESVKAAAAFQDSLQDTKTAIGGLKRSVFSEFMPAVTQVMDGLQDIFTGNYDEGFAKISEGVDNAVAKIAEIAPKALEIGGKIISAIAQAFVNNAPELITALLTAFTDAITQLATMIPTIIQTLVPVIIELTPVILEAGIQLFLGLLQALAETAPTIIDTLVDAILDMIDLLIDYAPEFLEAMLTVMAAIIEALVRKAPEILSRLAEMITKLVQKVAGSVGQMANAAAQFIGGFLSSIGNAVNDAVRAVHNVVSSAVDAVGDFFNDMFNAGADLVQGLIDGIADNITGVLDTITGGLQDAVDSALDFLGIASPSKLFKWIGDMSMQGMAEGIEDTAKEAEKAMRDAAEDIYGAAEGEVNLTSNVGKAVNGIAAGPGVSIVIEKMEVRDDRDISLIAKELNRLISRQSGGTIWNGSFSAA